MTCECPGAAPPTADGVFGGLFLFFVVMPAVLFAATCAVCTGAMAPNPTATDSTVRAEPRAQPAQVRRYVVVDDAAASAHVRRTPGSTSDGDVVGRVAAGTGVRVLESRRLRAGMLDGYGFDFGGERGWISQYVTTGKVEEVDERTGGSTVRKTYSAIAAKERRR